MPDTPSSFTEAQRQEIKAIMHEALTEYFRDTGKSAKALLITTATVVGALVVIFGGIKSVLGWIGFTYIR